MRENLLRNDANLILRENEERDEADGDNPRSQPSLLIETVLFQSFAINNMVFGFGKKDQSSGERV
jgi:hypothetical protein